MKIWWRWVTAHEPHTCSICGNVIQPNSKCWMLSEWIEFLNMVKNTFTCRDCEACRPTMLRDQRPEDVQLSLL